MALVLTSAPTLEPVSLDEAKAHLRLDSMDDDALITSLIATARLYVERMLSRALITQSWSLFLDAWPEGYWLTLPLAPVQAVSAVTTYAADDAPSVFDTGDYWLDAVSDPPRLVLRGTQPWPAPGRRANGIEVAFTAGHGDAATDVPAPLRQAILLLVAHWYEHREPVVESAGLELPGTAAALLMPYRSLHL